jgi:hypothetical protein
MVTGVEKRSRVQPIQGNEKYLASIKYKSLEELLSNCHNPKTNM